MANKKEIREHLKIALKEIGAIYPWFDKNYSCWVFNHSAYPVEYSGDSEEEVIKNYPIYLSDFIEERLNENLSELTEKKTKGRGGFRKGSGRPFGTKKEPTRRVTLPLDIANWIIMPETIAHLRALGLPK